MNLARKNKKKAAPPKQARKTTTKPKAAKPKAVRKPAPKAPAKARKSASPESAALAIVDRIQEGMAAGLGFQAIVDLAGDKLREVFTAGEVSIRWHEPRANQIHFLY